MRQFSLVIIRSDRNCEFPSCLSMTSWHVFGFLLLSMTKFQMSMLAVLSDCV